MWGAVETRLSDSQKRVREREDDEPPCGKVYGEIEMFFLLQAHHGLRKKFFPCKRMA